MIAQHLETAHHVPSLTLPAPVGLEATGAWLTAIAEATGRSDAAAELHRSELEAVAASPADTVFAGLRVYIGFPVSPATAVALLVHNSGGTVVGISVDHVDADNVYALKTLQEKQPGVPLHVAGGQPFEEGNLLRKLAPDLYIGTPERAVWAARAGIPAVAIQSGELFGYDGLRCLLSQVNKALVNKAFVQRLGQAAPPPYKEAWYRRSPDWHIKQEVR